MRYRRFGQTQYSFSVFSLGLMRCLQSPDLAIATLQRALELGINHVETARGYGQSEAYLGQALKTLERSQLYITTKAPPSSDADSLARSIDTSLATLGIDTLDSLAIHGINTPEHLAWIQDPRGGMAAVWQAVDDGRIRQVGFSSHGPLTVIQGAIATGQFAFVNLHYNLFFRRNEPAIAQAHARDMGVFIISPADKGGLLFTPPQTLQEQCAPLSPLHLNYRFLLSDRRITTLSLGAATPAELDLPLAIADQDGPLTATEQAILQRLDIATDQALGRDRCRQCYACLPCPEAIHIPEVLRLRNLALAHDMTAYGEYRYRMFENAGHWFPGRKAIACTDCGDCLPRCPEQLDIPTLLRDAHQRLNGPERRRLWG
jgi:predicted aldo/keto reductase-like oxidoreductase